MNRMVEHSAIRVVIYTSSLASSQGWLSPRQKGISPLPWGETGEKTAESGEIWGETARCVYFKVQLHSNLYWDTINY